MNSIANFRLCKLTDEELIKIVDQGCDNMYKTGKIPPRHIPAKPDEDFDLVLGELLHRFQKLTSSNSDYAKCPNCHNELEITGVKCLSCDYSDEHFA